MTREKLFQPAFGPGCGPQGAAALLVVWQGGRARSGTERGDSGARLGASQGVCSPLPGSCAGSVLHELGISKHLGEPGEAPARLPSQGAGG